jgi:hypothetical protein
MAVPFFSPTLSWQCHFRNKKKGEQWSAEADFIPTFPANKIKS